MCKFFKREKKVPKEEREKKKLSLFDEVRKDLIFFLLKPNEIHLIHSIYTEASANKLKIKKKC